MESCPTCGKPIEGSAAYCPHCGENLTKKEMGQREIARIQEEIRDKTIHEIITGICGGLAIFFATYILARGIAGGLVALFFIVAIVFFASSFYYSRKRRDLIKRL